MKRLGITSIALLLLVLPVFSYGFDDHEYAPIGEKEIEYKNWTYKNASTDQDQSLRDLAVGKKLVLVFYFAHWCHSSNYQAPMTQKLYEKYKDDGLGVIGVAMYGSLADTQNKMRWWQLTFPVVTETLSSRERLRSPHFTYRTATGDTRKWATPWNIFLVPGEFKTEGDVLVEKAFVANGELVETEAEAFIREKLGLPAEKRDTGKEGRGDVGMYNSQPNLKLTPESRILTPRVTASPPEHPSISRPPATILFRSY